MAERYSVKKWEKDEVRAIRDEYRAKARELKREADIALDA